MRTSLRGALRRAAIAAAMLVASAPHAFGQQSLNSILSFLLTNRSIPTQDFVQDEQAAAATRDAITGALLLELTTLPVNSSAGGFTYRLNPTLGTVERSSVSFGPFLTERSLTAGSRRASFSLSYQASSFVTLDGHDLRDGTLVATASKFHNQAQPFDVETVTLRISSQTLSLLANYGLADRLDVGVAVPFVTLNLSGTRIDAYHGQQFPQASASASASGLGDVAIRAKYNVWRTVETGVAIGAEARLPTGNGQNLLGAGKAAAKPLVIGSIDRGRFAVNGNVAYTFGGLSDEFDYGGAVTVASAERLTLVGELVGRRVNKLGALTQTTEPNPLISGVDTIRLASSGQGADHVVAVAGVKWNPAATWLLSASVVRAVTTAGFNSRWTPTVTFDYSFGR